MSTTTRPATWQEALENHPVATARALEKQLQGSVSRDKEKLRVLVGNNYRDLLGTAEQIVDLNRQGREAESSISSLSQACKPPQLQHETKTPLQTIEVASQLRLLDQMLRCASKASKDKSVLTASKIYLVARLLLSSLEQAHGTNNTTTWLQGRLKSLRSQLLRCVDNLLLRPDTTFKTLVHATGAYCLTTSSAATDALKHFQALRLQRISRIDAESATTSSTVGRKRLLQTCHYLIASVAAIKALSRRALAELLNSLQKQPILEDSKLVEIETLQLDLHQSLLPKDILSFTPYFKKSVLTGAEVRASAEAWVKEGITVLVRDAEKLLRPLKLAEVLQIRKQLFDVILPSCFSSLIYMTGIERIRAVFSSRIVDLVKVQAFHLQTFLDIEDSIDSQPDDQQLWTSDILHVKTHLPTSKYLNSLRSLHLGLHKELQNYMQKLRRWARTCSLAKEALVNVGNIRWQDKIEEDDDDDENISRHIASALSKEDSEQFINELNSALSVAIEEFVTAVADLTSTLSEESLSPSTSRRTTALLRIIRETRFLFSSLSALPRSDSLSRSATKLQETLAKQTASELNVMVESQELNPNRAFVAEDLPSPQTMYVLQQLSSIMSKNGGMDLWPTTAIQKLQSIVFKRAMSAEKRKFYVRSEFDEQFLKAALGQSSPEIKDSDTTGRKALLYWNRTRSLYGVLNT